MSGILPSPGDTGINKTNPWLLELTFLLWRQLTNKVQLQAALKNKIIMHEEKKGYFEFGQGKSLQGNNAQVKFQLKGAWVPH